METISQLDNKLLKRKEIVVKVHHHGNPGFAKATEEIAHNFKSSPENVVIKRIDSSFGQENFKIEAMIYDSVEGKNNTEPKKKEKKKQ